ncbi:hypothetical protein [Litchfieldia alkalitelluris]|uniref:hypothetical protein n=1 Tax=Litchfieldia alkalitelluris TaxID=304268 RepID=UPI0009986D4F|nr:hypothetical protein [Litchfieldia alkalitelluris]
MNKDILLESSNGIYKIKLYKPENKTKKFINRLLNNEFPFLLKQQGREEKHQGFTIDEYANTFSLVTDKLILETTSNESLQFISGKLEFSIEKCKKYFQIKIHSFFKNCKGEWIVKAAELKADLMVLNQEGRHEIEHENVIEFYLTEPNKK